MVADWLNIRLEDTYSIDEYTFLLARRDAFISRMRRTDGGREYLDRAWTLEQTRPDRASLRKAFA